MNNIEIKLQSYLLWLLAHAAGVHWQYGVPGTQVQYAWGTVEEESAEVGRTIEHIWTQDLGICTQKQRQEMSAQLSVIWGWQESVRRTWWRKKSSKVRNRLLTRLFAEKRFKEIKDIQRCGSGDEWPWLHPALSHNRRCRLTPVIPLNRHHSWPFFSLSQLTTPTRLSLVSLSVFSFFFNFAILYVYSAQCLFRLKLTVKWKNNNTINYAWSWYSLNDKLIRMCQICLFNKMNVCAGLPFCYPFNMCMCVPVCVCTSQLRTGGRAVVFRLLVRDNVCLKKHTWKPRCLQCLTKRVLTFYAMFKWNKKLLIARRCFTANPTNTQHALL